MEVKIEQRLQDPPRFLFLPMDEAIALGMPICLGAMSQQFILGALIAVIFWFLWKKVKGEGSTEDLLTITYWYFPNFISIYPTFPDSAIDRWEG
ncbi:hypothetical protein MXMO3_03502 (plasmid) [Maritalea myrionectae]|jgi:conjugal transfer pilus assembly protein TraL|uniref:Type IV conjugative transfer system protein TraL n=1 Tax=Maritalea myrionectae TaxID=454601 RepID=A0A2R4MJ46_9HYPH|nr:type IV conjugative transfer system protein TraL [Maritalea myrionectae]AVX06005.1 hypothetical protein MXMO3_03502 [Maritalea myrionectae]